MTYNVLPEDDFLSSRTVNISTTTKRSLIIGNVILRLTKLNVHLIIENAEIQLDFNWYTGKENLLIIVPIDSYIKYITRVTLEIFIALGIKIICPEQRLLL